MGEHDALFRVPSRTGAMVAATNKGACVQFYRKLLSSSSIDHMCTFDTALLFELGSGEYGIKCTDHYLSTRN